MSKTDPYVAEFDETILAVPDKPTGALFRPWELVCHEAAHAVFSYRATKRVGDRGIDLAHRPEHSARGGAACFLFEDDPELPLADRKLLLMSNLKIICAGPACDAKLTGKSLGQSLRDQWSDHRNAVRQLMDAKIIERANEATAIAEMVTVLRLALEAARKSLDTPEVWALIVSVGKAVQEAAGKLPGPLIVATIEAKKKASQQSMTRSSYLRSA
jgi:hypothetical protein